MKDKVLPKNHKHPHSMWRCLFPIDNPSAEKEYERKHGIKASHYVYPFEWHQSHDPLAFRVFCYTDKEKRSQELMTDNLLDDAISKKEFSQLKDLFTQFTSSFNYNLDSKVLTKLIYLYAISHHYSEKDFTRLLQDFPINVLEKINYCAYPKTKLFCDESIEKTVEKNSANYSETLKEVTIRFGAKELTAVIEKMEKAQDQESVQEQDVTKKRRLY